MCFLARGWWCLETLSLKERYASPRLFLRVACVFPFFRDETAVHTEMTKSGKAFSSDSTVSPTACPMLRHSHSPSPRHAAPRRWVRGRTTRDERGHREGEPSPSRASVRPLVGRRTRDERAGPRSRERWWPPTRAGARWRRRRTSRAWSARACGSCAWTPTRRTSCSARTRAACTCSRGAARPRTRPRIHPRNLSRRAESMPTPTTFLTRKIPSATPRALCGSSRWSPRRTRPRSSR